MPESEAILKDQYSMYIPMIQKVQKVCDGLFL